MISKNLPPMRLGGLDIVKITFGRATSQRTYSLPSEKATGTRADTDVHEYQCIDGSPFSHVPPAGSAQHPISAPSPHELQGRSIVKSAHRHCRQSFERCGPDTDAPTAVVSVRFSTASEVNRRIIADSPLGRTTAAAERSSKPV